MYAAFPHIDRRTSVESSVGRTRTMIPRFFKLTPSSVDPLVEEGFKLAHAGLDSTGQDRVLQT